MNKKNTYLLFLAFLYLGCTQSIFGQNNNFPNLANWHSKIFYPEDLLLQIDTFSIVEESIVIKNLKNDSILSADLYTINALNGTILLKTKIDSIQLFYRSFPFSLNGIKQNKSPEQFIKNDSLFADYFPYIPNASKPTFLDFDGLKYSGNFGRGINFGSNQDLVVNSVFDLQLSGQLSNGIEILAAITDNNIPLQPEGNTQQLQNFDRIYIQVKKDNHKLIGGDFDIKSNNSYFLKLYKQEQGIAYFDNYTIKKNTQISSQFGLAVAKGKFIRNTFVGEENNQGPYRLNGANGETFLIVLSGSEKVFVDGKLLKRGEEADYIIDYNIGELIFTPNFLITKDSRIIVDFQYADKNYLKTMIYTGHEGSWKNLKFNLDVYAEQDSKNKPILQNISDSVEQILGDIGNNLNQAYVSGITQVPYDPFRILYQQKDTLYNGILYDSIYIISNDSSLAKYQLSFTFLGQGNGNYEPSKNALNQRVYSWVAPIDGRLMGSYEPIIQIITPKKDHYVTAGLKYKINKKVELIGDFGFANTDKNTFSKIGDKENIGFAGHFGILYEDKIKKDSSITITTQINYDYKEKSFNPLAPFRSLEFSRDWNLKEDAKLDEHLATITTKLYSKNGWMAYIETGTLQKPTYYNGYNNKIGGSYIKGKWVLKANFNILNSKSILFKNSFIRPDLFITKDFSFLKGIKVGADYFQERNTLISKSSDSLLNTSYYNNNFHQFIQSSDSGFIQFLLDYKFRNDLFSDGFGFKKASSANTFEFKGKFLKLKNQELSWNFIVRNLNISDSTLIKNQAEKTYLGRGEYGVRLKKGLFKYNVIYELGSGRERIKEFSYLEVAAGKGVYRWLDENMDGIRQQNEFVVSEFQDSASFVKIFTTLNDYIKARQVGYNQTLSIQPRAIWEGLAGIKGFIAKLQLSSFLDVNRKSIEGAKQSPFNPFVFNSSDSSIVYSNLSSRNIFSYDPNSSSFTMSYSWQVAQDKTLLINGFDTRKRNIHTINSRIGMGNSFSTLLNISLGKESYFSEFFVKNIYQIKTYKLDPSIVYTYKTSLRLSVGYGFLWKKNDIIYGGEKNIANKLNLAIRYSKGGKQTIDSKFTFANVKYNGETGTTKAYLILEGLQQGKNYLWNLDYSRQLSKNLLLNLGYEGRKTGSSKIVNTGKASIRAIF